MNPMIQCTSTRSEALRIDEETHLMLGRSQRYFQYQPRVSARNRVPYGYRKRLARPRSSVSTIFSEYDPSVLAGHALCRPFLMDQKNKCAWEASGARVIHGSGMLELLM
jgi:hypothetical protein